MLRASSTAALLAALGPCACTGDLLHSTAWSSACDLGTDGCGGAAGHGGRGDGGASSATGVGAGDVGGEASTSSAGSAGSGGGAVCGNGVVEAGEECDTDDANSACVACAVVCSDVEHKDPVGLHCYQFVSAAAGGVTWAAASTACGDAGGHLAAIGSAEEQGFIEPLVVGEFAWIGATDMAARGVFAWVTGEPFDYVNWKPGQPDDANGVEDCVHVDALQLHLWNDLPCDQLHGYLCEREAL